MALEDAKNQVDTAITRDGLRGLSSENTFAGVTSFLRRTLTKDLTGVDIAVTGLPFDQAVTNRPGTRLGPRAIREASSLQAPDAPYCWGYNVMEEFAIADYGDMAFDYAVMSDVPKAIETHVAEILRQGVACVALGGDHFVSLPCVRAHAAQHGPVALVQFDAHGDTWADDDPVRVDHGTWVYKAAKEGILDVGRSIQVGIRTDNPDPLEFEILDAPEAHRIGVDAVVERIKARVGGAPVYLTFDIDCLDPAFAPGTGTPVWGGMASWQAAAILRGLAGINLVGADIVEVSPPFDHGDITAVAGAHVATELLCLWGWTRRQ